MAVETNGGWNFWVHEGRCVRLFTVADVSMAAAENIALAKTHFGVTISHEQVAEGVIGILRLSDGDIMEWVPAKSTDDPDPDCIKSVKY
jgi:hypothetical protein